MQNFKPLAIFCNCTAWFVSDAFGNPKDRFSHFEAHIVLLFQDIKDGVDDKKIHEKKGKSVVSLVYFGQGLIQDLLKGGSNLISVCWGLF